MHSSPSTRISLLRRLRDPDDEASWETFHAIYRSVIYRIGRHHGLSHDDAQDLTQNVLLKIHQHISDHAPEEGPAKFRTWLYTVTRHAAIDFMRRKRPDQGSGQTTINLQLQQIREPERAAQDGSWSDQLLEQEYRQQVFQHVIQLAKQEFSARAWSAFELTFLDGKSVKEVALAMNCSAGSIYASRARVLRRIRDLVLSMDDDLEPAR